MNKLTRAVASVASFLLPHQLKRLARRASLGLARNGSYSGNGSGDIFIAFSTANDNLSQVATVNIRAFANDQLDGTEDREEEAEAAKTA